MQKIGPISYKGQTNRLSYDAPQLQGYQQRILSAIAHISSTTVAIQLPASPSHITKSNSKSKKKQKKNKQKHKHNKKRQKKKRKQRNANGDEDSNTDYETDSDYDSEEDNDGSDDAEGKDESNGDDDEQDDDDDGDSNVNSGGHHMPDGYQHRHQPQNRRKSVVRHAKHQSLVSFKDAGEWNPTEVGLVEQEMLQAIQVMSNTEMVKINRKQEFLQELERRKADPNFGTLKNAMNNNNNNNTNNNNNVTVKKVSEWDVYEVCQWLIDGGFHPTVCQRFFDHKIDGSVIIFDMEPQLAAQLGITGIEMKKFFRMVNKLRQIWQRQSMKLTVEIGCTAITIESECK